MDTVGTDVTVVCEPSDVTSAVVKLLDVTTVVAKPLVTVMCVVVSTLEVVPPSVVTAMCVVVSTLEVVPPSMFVVVPSGIVVVGDSVDVSVARLHDSGGGSPVERLSQIPITGSSAYTSHVALKIVVPFGKTYPS